MSQSARNKQEDVLYRHSLRLHRALLSQRAQLLTQFDMLLGKMRASYKNLAKCTARVDAQQVPQLAIAPQPVQGASAWCPLQHRGAGPATWPSLAVCVLLFRQHA